MQEKQKSLILPSGHRQVKWGLPAINEENAVSQTIPEIASFITILLKSLVIEHILSTPRSG